MANVEKFKYWCNKILPLVYDDSLSYYEFLGKVYEKLNETIDAVNSNTEAVAEFDQRINDFIAAETAAREGWEDQQERDRQSWEDQQAQKWSAFQAMFISEYDPDDAYVKGALCRVQHKMYVANASTTGTFDPTKWDEIVLSDYLAEYVQTAAINLQSQYDTFLENYQRQFGVTQTTGSSATDAISQAGFTTEGMVNKGYLPEGTTTLKTLSPGFYRFRSSDVENVTDLPPIFSNSGGFIIVYYSGTTNTNRSFIVGELSPGLSIDHVPRQMYYGAYVSTYPDIYWKCLGLASLPAGTTTLSSITTPGAYQMNNAARLELTDIPEMWKTSALFLITNQNTTRLNVLITNNGEVYIRSLLLNGTVQFDWKNVSNAVSFDKDEIYKPTEIGWSNVTTYDGNAFTASSSHLMSDLIYFQGEPTNLRVSQPKTGYSYKLHFYTNGKWSTSFGPSTSTYDQTIPANHDIMALRVEIIKANSADISYTDDTGIKMSFYRKYQQNEKMWLSGKRLSLLGDSLTTFGGSMSDDPSTRISDGTWTYAGNRCRYPQSNLLFNVSDTYWYRLMQYFDLSYGVNDSWAGSRVSWDGSTESADIGANKYIASPTRIGHLDDNGTPDIIIINGGTNDITHNVTIGTFNYESPQNYTDEQIAALPVATFADAYRALLIRVLKAYPNARLFCLLPNFTNSYYTPDKADRYNEIIKEACDYFGVTWIDARTAGITIYNYRNYLPDNIHYNAGGMYLLYKKIKAELEKL